MTDRYEFTRFPPEPERLAWCDWLRHHGIDPDDVVAVGWIERRVEQRQIAYEAYVRNADGNILYDAERDDARREIHVFQLEARPSPFPDLATARGTVA